MSNGLVHEHYPMQDTELPAGWVMCAIGCVAESISSGFPSGEHNSQGRGVPHIRPMNIDREGRFDLSLVKSVDGEIPKLLEKGDVLFNNTNSPELIGKTTVIPISAPLAYSNHMTRIRLEKGMNPSFVAKQLHFLWMSGYFRHRCKNHVNQASIAAEPLSRTVPLLVAPAKTQERIADTLDELLSDLDAGVAALERARAKLKQYRSAVLKAAVEGALTAEWRGRHPVVEPASELLDRILAERRRRWEATQLQKFKAAEKAPPKDWKAKYPQPIAPDNTNLPVLPPGWCWATASQLAWSSSYGTSQKCSETNKGLAVLRIPNVIGGRLDFTDLKYAPTDERDEDLVGLGDILIIRTNGSRTLIGRGAVIRETLTQRYSFASYLIRLRIVPHSSLLGWVAALWESPFVRQWIEARAATSAGQYNVSLGVLETLAVPLPPENEQLAIAEAVEDQLSVIEHLETDLDTRMQGSTALRQSILRHAFSGQLVSQDPTDEPASELLKRIAAEREERARQVQAAKLSNAKAKTTKSPRKSVAKTRK